MGVTIHPPTGGGWDQWDRAGFRVFVVDGCSVVAAHGDIDLDSAVGLDQALHSALRSSPDVIIDLTHVLFIDSSGLGVLVRARRDAAALGGSMSLVQPPAIVRKILVGSQLHEFFAIFSTLDEALSATQTA